MKQTERRQFKRIPARFELFYSKAGSTIQKQGNGFTTNVAPGGVFFETAEIAFEHNELLQIEMSIPPKTGQVESGAKLTAYARVLRIYPSSGLCEKNNPVSQDAHGVAVKLCRPVKFHL